ncbi:hypothetical protein FQN57_006324 [Myotisia sp. PD_48]|nr:hypothetical protein FQN57_006324 [Myotisia sp. PD_48]
MTSGGQGSYNTIKVVARFRPQNKIEIANHGETIVEFDSEETCRLYSKNVPSSFTFDRIFEMSSRQIDVFDYSIRSTVDDIMNGYNGTVFAYGQTGAGKSYTMMGSDIDDDEGKGIIPRIVEQIFTSILTSPGNIEYTVRVSYMEIYMERIRDLLVPQNDNLPIHEEKNRGVYVKGLLEIYVSSVQEVYEVMRRGDSSRAVAATSMNLESSRSHSIFVVTITQKNVETGSAKSGQLFLVDLAGSEKVGKTGASGQTLEEAKKINKSLSALGMVINALTDGKSTHIPYRDSKLTRILQESLGGNTRTTLIINCSPSSFNDAETLSTLRFGVRAKAIKNKAKINQELSPAELKQLLKKAQNQVTTFETYISALETEVQVWRNGDNIAKERWTPLRTGDGVSSIKTEARLPRPGTPSRLQTEASRSESSSRPDSRLGDRSSTPSLVLERDEREEFLRRENELQDQLTEKESHIANTEKDLQEKNEELKMLKESMIRANKENDKLNTEVNELRMQLERVSYEGKEQSITMDTLKDANSELTSELDDLKQQLLDVRMRAKETSAALDEKDKKKAERMAQMMAGFDMKMDVFSENERKIQQLVEHVDSLHSISLSGEAVAPDDFLDLRGSLIEAQGVVRQAELAIVDRNENQTSSDTMLLEKISELRREMTSLLERNLGENDITEIKDRLNKVYTDSQEAEYITIEALQNELSRKSEEINRLKQAATEANGQVANGTASINSKTLQQQIADFDNMKKSLMRDLQNRCERVVELEISLDETREQYKQVLQSSNNRAQQKKMAFLERNLEQLTHVQRQLVEQNGSLKREVAIAERKLIARNERIESLESLLQDSQEKLTAANHRFEAQLTAMKERLEAAKAGSTRGLSSDGAGFGFGGSRIAKPLRGGGGTDNPSGPPNQALSNVQTQESSGGGKRINAADKQWHLTTPAPYDPPLTYGGWKQARALGIRIGSILQYREEHGCLPGNLSPYMREDFEETNQFKASNRSSEASHNKRPRKHRVIVHTSPFLRCVQTAISLSAGINMPKQRLVDSSDGQSPSQKAPPSHSQRNPASPFSHRSEPPQLPPIQEPVQDPDQYIPGQSGGESIHTTWPCLLRLDAYLGEWLSPDYFEHITPPPGSVMMLAAAKAELLRQPESLEMAALKRLPGGLTNFPDIDHSTTATTDPEDSSPPTQFSSSTPKPTQPTDKENSTKDSPYLPKLSIHSQSFPNDEYIPPTPMYAISLSDHIPTGYVTHARNACVEVDFQWDSMRAPLDWGNGGEYGEEWSSMHRRFRNGLDRMVNWYQTNNRQITRRRLSNREEMRKVPDHVEDRLANDDDTDTVLILVTHGAGCNALLGALTNRPVLLDIGMASLTVAALREDALTSVKPTDSAPIQSTPSSRSPSTDVAEEYEVKLVASTEHLRVNNDYYLASQPASVRSFPSIPPYRHRLSSMPGVFGTAENNSFSLSDSPTHKISYGGISKALHIGSSSMSSTRPLLGLWGSKHDSSEDIIPNFGDSRPSSEQVETTSKSNSSNPNTSKIDGPPPFVQSHQGLWRNPSSSQEREPSKRRWTVAERSRQA